MQLTRGTGQILLSLAVGVVIGTGYGVWLGSTLNKEPGLQSFPDVDTSSSGLQRYVNTRYGYAFYHQQYMTVHNTWLEDTDDVSSSSAITVTSEDNSVRFYLYAWPPTSRRMYRAHKGDPTGTLSLSEFAREVAADQAGYEGGYADDQWTQTFRNITWNGLDAYESLWGWEPDTETGADARTRMLFFEKDGVKYELQYTNNPETRDIVNSFTFVSRPQAAGRP